MATAPTYTISTPQTVTWTTVVTESIAFPTKTDYDNAERGVSRFDEPEPSFTAVNAETTLTYTEQA